MAQCSFRFTAWQSAYLTAITKAVQSHLESTLGWNETDGFDVQILASDITTDDNPKDGNYVSGVFRDMIIQFHPRNESVKMSVGRSALEGDLHVHKRQTGFGFTYYDVLVMELREHGDVVG